MLLSSFWVQAQEIEMADVMRSNGKIYVVVAVILIIFTGLLVYLVGIDRRLKRLEEDNK
jgi:CcmD family protein